MELWDVYNGRYEKIGKTITRGMERLETGEYHLVVHVWIQNSKGEFLIQKRSQNKETNPNMWAMTGGAVIAGEDTRDACIREVEEELGIVLTMEDANMIRRKKREKDFLDIWFIRQDINVKDMKMQKEEVVDVKWASEDEINRLFEAGEFGHSGYESFKMCLNYLKFQ